MQSMAENNRSRLNDTDIDSGKNRNCSSYGCNNGTSVDSVGKDMARVAERSIETHGHDFPGFGVFSLNRFPLSYG